jgi:membrane fusion protein, multidrug efflux system
LLRCARERFNGNRQREDGELNEVTKITAEDVADAAPLNAAPRKRRLRLAILLSVPLIIIAAGLWFWLTSGGTVSTDNAQIDAPTVSIAPEVSGRIISVPVSENGVVKAGDLLFAIDPAPYRIALLQAEAAMATARVGYAQLEGTATSKSAEIASKSADIAAAASRVRLAQQTLARQEELMRRGFTTRAQLDSARAAVIAAQQAEVAAVAQRQVAQATAASAQAALGKTADGVPPALAAAMAQREKAQLDLARTQVRAPIGGRVTQADRLEVGNMATMSLPVVSVVGTGGYWISANFKETQLAKIRVGQRAEIEIDAIPGRKFAARVTGIGAGTGSQFSLLPAQNATGNWVKVTQRVPVRLQFTEPVDRPLVAGWSATVTVSVAN